ncbi:MAG: hypothetical protein CM15mV122_120 [uncultured marine virus]|nr:MAG: hypothetical protein CM15mV122_120 [uncultured marine virus]
MDGPQVVVQDYNGNNFLVGKEHGVKGYGGTIVTGSGMAELSGFTLTMTARKQHHHFSVLLHLLMIQVAQLTQLHNFFVY